MLNKAYCFIFSDYNLYKKHPYGRITIGSDEDLEAANIDDFVNFNKKYHKPNNAILVVAGDIRIDETKDLIDKYFSDIPKSDDIVRNLPKEEPIIETNASDDAVIIPK